MSHAFWKAGSSTERPALDHDLEVDVLVVGGGIAGVSVAWELAAAGGHVALVEAARIGYGATGHSTGKVSALQGERYLAIEKALGKRASGRYAESQLFAMHHLAGQVERLHLDCGFSRQSAYLFAETSEELDELTEQVNASRRAGIDLRFTLSTGLPFPAAGAARLTQQVGIDPLAYVDALAHHVVRHGGSVFENTKVVDLQEGRPHTVTTTGSSGNHVVRADHVVIATHFPAFDRALLFPRLHPRREFVLATGGSGHPIIENLHGMYLSAANPMRSVRKVEGPGQSSLVVTGMPFTPGSEDADDALAQLRDWADERFGAPEWTATWATQDNDTADQLPFIGPLHPFARNAWVASGFGGWGLTNGVLAGVLIRDLIDGRESPYASLFHTRRLAPVAEAKSLTKAALRVTRHWVGDRVHARMDKVDSPDEIGPGQAAYLNHDGPWAAYRDAAGELTTVSAVCTHQGCLVRFNEPEKSWDCPCHGSRFAVDGRVVEGPATEPLAPHPGFPDKSSNQ